MSTLIADATLLAHDISEFVPHRAPMILIDNLLEHQPDSLLTAIHINEASAYFDSAINGVPNYVGIEYMAQSIAALAGVEAKLMGDKVRVGFLLGSRKLQMHIGHFILGQTYHTRVSRLYQEPSGLAVFDCQISHQGHVIASANVNVFQPQDTQAYINENQTSPNS
ncbi:hotdog family protein [Shewanella litoralis]|uniref:Thioester dehydrase n=1 Tax=Shewanella litoralis TaxID=2282700 RepID=A0ABQ2QY71_9GAMM|nr:hotdog family protein [Shewanella litoralis]GGQ03630.1 thioester dehydrase [Shewanella litoralis]